MKASRTLLTIALSALITAAAVTIVSNGTRPARAQGGPELTPYQVAQQVNLDPAGQEICFTFPVPGGSTLTIDHIAVQVQPVSNTGALPAVLLSTTKLSPFLLVQGPRIPLQIVGSIAVGSQLVVSLGGSASPPAPDPRTTRRLVPPAERGDGRHRDVRGQRLPRGRRGGPSSVAEAYSRQGRRTPR